MVDEPGSDLPQAARAMLDVLIGMVMMVAEVAVAEKTLAPAVRGYLYRGTRLSCRARQGMKTPGKAALKHANYPARSMGGRDVPPSKASDSAALTFLRSTSVGRQ